MTEEQVKFLCKWMVDNGNRPLTEFEKRTYKASNRQCKKSARDGCICFSVANKYVNDSFARSIRFLTKKDENKYT